MNKFQEPFKNHFHSEISTISKFADHPKAPKAGTPEEAAASATFKAWGKATVTKAGVMDVVPFFLLNLDRTVEDGLWANWPPHASPYQVGADQYRRRMALWLVEVRLLRFRRSAS